MKLKDSAYTPGRFSSTSAPSLEDYDMVPVRRVKFTTPQSFYNNDEDRKISTVSNISVTSSDYCEVMTDFDEANGENDSLTGSNKSADSALSAVSIGLTNASKNSDFEMDEIVKEKHVGMHRSISESSTSPLIVSTMLSARL